MCVWNIKSFIDMIPIYKIYPKDKIGSYMRITHNRAIITYENNTFYPLVTTEEISYLNLLNQAAPVEEISIMTISLLYI